MLIVEQRIQFAYSVVHAGSNGEGLSRTHPREYVSLKRAAFLVKNCNGAYAQHAQPLEEVPLVRAVRRLLFLPKVGFFDRDADEAKRTAERLVREGYLRLKDEEFGTVEGAPHEDTVRDLAAVADTVHWTAQNHRALNAPGVDYRRIFELIARYAPLGHSLDTAHALLAMVKGETVDEAFKDAATTILVQISAARSNSN